jgi:hypothetical protein
MEPSGLDPDTSLGQQQRFSRPPPQLQFVGQPQQGNNQINHHRPNSRMTMLAKNRFKFLFEK